VLRAGAQGGSCRVGTRPAQRHDVWHVGGDDHHRICGVAGPARRLRQPAILPAAIATLFVAAVMFPLNVILLEIGLGRHGSSASATLLAKQIVLNPMGCRPRSDVDDFKPTTSGANGGLYAIFAGAPTHARSLR
jgi:hypothetical protein